MLSFPEHCLQHWALGRACCCKLPTFTGRRALSQIRICVFPSHSLVYEWFHRRQTSILNGTRDFLKSLQSEITNTIERTIRNHATQHTRHSILNSIQSFSFFNSKELKGALILKGYFSLANTALFIIVYFALLLLM